MSYVSIVSDRSIDPVLLAAPLRRAGIACETQWTGKIKSQMRRTQDAAWTVICENGATKLRRNASGQSIEAARDEIVAALLSDKDDEADWTPLAEALVYTEQLADEYLETFPQHPRPMTLTQYKVESDSSASTGTDRRGECNGNP